MSLVFVLLTLPSADADRVDYARDIKPIVAARCFACHGALKQEGSLRLDTAQAMIQGGETGPALVAGVPGESPIVERISSDDDSLRMPPADSGTRLTELEIALIDRWIVQGATAPTDEEPEADPSAHWAFTPPQLAAIPPTTSPTATGPIDAFLLAKLESRGIAPVGAAPARTLARRLHLDLVGLPPDEEELARFADDPRPDRLERRVDQLLASPRYGERWGRHWMDVWRYSDWWGLGAEVRYSQKHIWHWRDWIVESLNADVGYDEMIRQMLAADELYPNDTDRLRATGYLVRMYFKFNRNTWLEETVEHTGKAFLGVTLNCTKCHDHKYDPFTQRDFYRFRAFFEPYQVRTDFVPGETDPEKNGIPRAFDVHAETPTYLFVRGNEQDPNKDESFAPGVPDLLAAAVKLPSIEPVTLPLLSVRPGLRSFVVDDLLRSADQEITAARASLEKTRADLSNLEQAAPPDPAAIEKAKAHVALAERVLAKCETKPPTILARAMADRARFGLEPGADTNLRAREAARAERQLQRAERAEALAQSELNALSAPADKREDADKKVAEAKDALAKAEQALAEPSDSYTSIAGALKAPESNLETEESRRLPYPETSTGRRTALARWITDPAHPLTARVATNHLWMRHFGEPLVPTVFDFGRKGTPPLHRELLDSLAIELIENGWSMKHLHRAVVTSAAYGRDSSVASASTTALEEDSENRLYWRMNPRRMEAQVVRDSLLALAGDLDTTMGGPSLDPKSDATQHRRGLYFVHSHNDQNPFLAAFDDASVLQCYRRSESIVPQQALALTNSKLALTSADRIADEILHAGGALDDVSLARRTWSKLLAEVPTLAEERPCAEALGRFRSLYADLPAEQARRQALSALVRTLINHNDFVTIR